MMSCNVLLLAGFGSPQTFTSLGWLGSEMSMICMFDVPLCAA